MTEAFPPIADLVPQRGRMCLLERVLAHEERETRCAARPERTVLFRDAAGRVPVWVGLEYMAQCAAAHAGLRLRTFGRTPQAGFFLGSRKVVFRADAFDPGQPLEVTARHATGRTKRFAFECAVLDPAGGAPLVEGRLNLLAVELPEGMELPR